MVKQADRLRAAAAAVISGFSIGGIGGDNPTVARRYILESPQLQALANAIRSYDIWAADQEKIVEALEEMKEKPRKIEAAEDWHTLALEAKRGIPRPSNTMVSYIAVFIADNTSDPRADGPPGSRSFAPGYHQMIEEWLRQEGILSLRLVTGATMRSFRSTIASVVLACSIALPVGALPTQADSQGIGSSHRPLLEGVMPDLTCGLMIREDDQHPIPVLGEKGDRYFKTAMLIDKAAKTFFPSPFSMRRYALQEIELVKNTTKMCRLGAPGDYGEQALPVMLGVAESFGLVTGP